MKFELFEVPVSPLGADYEAPTITSLQTTKDALLCGFLFSSPALVRVPLQKNGAPVLNADKKLAIEDLSIEEQAGDDLLGVFNGLRPSASGEAVCTMLHSGFLPGVFRGLLGKDIKGKKGEALLNFLKKQEAAGAALRHSVVHVEETGNLRSRSFKEPGVLWDVVHVGDFVFGLGSSSIWREPYLKPDKREFLRSDLGANFSIHRDEDGNFWFLGANQRLMRMGQNSVKAQLTTLKSSDSSGLFISSSSHVDTWMYVTANNGLSLLRIRINPISREEEMQVVAQLEQPISALVAVDHPEISKVIFAQEHDDGARIYSFPIVKPLDPEMIPELPVLKLEGTIRGVACVSSLTQSPLPVPVVHFEDTAALGGNEGAASAPGDERKMNWGPKPDIWAAAGRLGRALEGTPPRILHISEI